MAAEPHPPTARQAGFALPSALLALVLLSLMATLMLTATVREVQQNGSNTGLVQARAAAEAGQADAMFYLAMQGVTDMNTALTWYADAFAQDGSKNAARDPIIPNASIPAALTALRSGMRLQFTGTAGAAQYTSTITLNDLVADHSSFSAEGQGYYVNYEIESTGTQNTYRRSVHTRGEMLVRLGRRYLNQWLMVAESGGASCGNNQICYLGTGSSYDGPVHFNTDVAFWGTPQFMRGVTTAAASVYMYNCQTRRWVTTSTQSLGCTTPNWGTSGIQYNAERVDLPTNAYSQARAALGLSATTLTAPTARDICDALNTAKPASCNGNTPTVANGVYLPRNGQTLTGGIYIQGNARNIVVSNTNGRQRYVITDSAGTTTTTIEVDYGTRTTSVKVGNAAPVTYTGIPSGTPAANTTTPDTTAMLYSSGTIESLSGPPRTGPLPTPAPDIPPAQVPAALAPDTKLNIAAATDVIIQGDLTYAQDPRSNPQARNVLGVIAGTGNIRVGTNAPNDVYIQGALLAGNTNRGLQVDNYSTRPYQGSVHLLGSVAQYEDQLRGRGGGTDGSLVNGYSDDFHFDTRFANGGAAPPFYPATTRFGVQTAYPEQQKWREQ